MFLGDIINADTFQVIQDDIAEATEMAILTVDYKGTPVTKHSRCSEYCKMIRQYPEYNELCQKCDSRGGLEAVRMKEPYIYICHAGLVDFATPILVNGQYLGAVMAGQIIIEEADKEKLEQIVSIKHSGIELMSKKEPREAYKSLPVMNLDKIKSISRMMFHISNYIVKEAVLKISLNEINDKIFRMSKSESLKTESLNFNNIPLNHEDKDEFHKNAGDGSSHEEKLHEQMKVIQEEPVYNGSIILRPALEYIHNNCGEDITLNKMASLCNISPSYFSKLFKREIKENFSNYVNKVRINKAKELLQNSDIPVINISIDLGFEDCGYFIKVFKNLEGVTPAAYRKRFNN